MSVASVSRILIILSVAAVVKMFKLDASLMRHARVRCLQQFPRAETVNFIDSHETQCFLHCFLYKAGLMDLMTRGLDVEKIYNLWEYIEEPIGEDDCLDRFDFCEQLNGSCNDTYRKLMQFRHDCLELFEYIFSINSTVGTANPEKSKQIGQSATEFCDQLERKHDAATENTEEDDDASIITQYQEKLKCIFENIHYLDAYGRVDETEIRLSFQEAQEYSADSQAVVRICAQRANSKYQANYLGNTVAELQKCLTTLSPVYTKVFNIRDENSEQY